MSSNATDRWADPEKQLGFALGKRVWFRHTFDGQRLAKQYGSSGVLASKDHDPYLLRLVDFDGTQVWIAEAHLRLTPPPSLSGEKVQAKATKPPVRKEAIKPEYGTELTIFDALEGE